LRQAGRRLDCRHASYRASRDPGCATSSDAARQPPRGCFFRRRRVPCFRAVAKACRPGRDRPARFRKRKRGTLMKKPGPSSLQPQASSLQPAPIAIHFNAYRPSCIYGQNGVENARFRRIRIKNRKKRSKTARFPLPILPQRGQIVPGASKTSFSPPKRALFRSTAKARFLKVYNGDGVAVFYSSPVRGGWSVATLREPVESRTPTPLCFKPRQGRLRPGAPDGA